MYIRTVPVWIRRSGACYVWCNEKCGKWLGVLRIVVVLPALLTRKEVQLGSGTIHEPSAMLERNTRTLSVYVYQNLHKGWRVNVSGIHRQGAVYLTNRVYVWAYVSCKNVIQGTGCASVTRNSEPRLLSVDIQQRFSNLPTGVFECCFL